MKLFRGWGPQIKTKKNLENQTKLLWKIRHNSKTEAEWTAAKAKHAEDAWTAAWNTAFDTAYKDRQKDSTFNESVSVVTVTGVGNIANVNASGQSKFNVNLSPREIPSYESQVAALNGSVISTAADGSKTITRALQSLF